jgi:predicted secreted hydrolase
MINLPKNSKNYSISLTKLILKKINNFTILYYIIAFLLSTKIYSFQFPEDHSFHKNFDLEWCYFIGNLESDDNEIFGYEISFFKAKISNKIEIFPVHFAISHISKNRYYQSQSLNRISTGLVEYNKNQIIVEDYKLKFLNDTTFLLEINPRKESISLNLELKIQKDFPILPQGRDGISKKSRIYPEVFSYYYSIPRLLSKGQIQIENKKFNVSGLSWMDHEWSNGKDTKNQKGIESKSNSWEWVCIQLDEETDIVVFNYRHSPNDPKETFATLRKKATNPIYILDESNVKFEPTKDIWKSPKTKISYNLNWIIEVDDYKLQLSPRMKTQEFNALNSTGNIYWEGSVEINGLYKDKPVKGLGYLEVKGKDLK